MFAILAGGIALTIDGGLNLARNNRNRSIAANLASQEMDQVRQEPFTSLPLGLVDRSESVGGVPYTVRRESEWVDNDSTTGPCDSTNGIPQVLRVTVSVFWADMRGVAPAKSSTILSPPVGSYDPNNGHIAVKVLGSGDADPRGGALIHDEPVSHLARPARSVGTAKKARFRNASVAHGGVAAYKGCGISAPSAASALQVDRGKRGPRHRKQLPFHISRSWTAGVF